MDTVDTVSGFSLTNRWLLYASIMLTPAQFISGIGSNQPTSIGFLAYNWYTQISWYQAVRGQQLHALSLLLPHFNFIYVITYIGGVSAGNIYMGILLGLGSAGVIILNTVSAWVSWATNQPDGFGVYQFYFFGWRTLSAGWHKFFLLWQIGDSFLALNGVMFAIYVAVAIATVDVDDASKETRLSRASRWTRSLDWMRYAAIPLGAAAMLVFAWPLILWTELIYARNNIVSETDMIAVYLFIAQVGVMMIPSWSSVVKAYKFITRTSDSAAE